VVQVGSWGYYMQGNGHQREVDICGSQLSERLSCSVHYPAYGKRLFECRCGVLFPAYVVQAAVDTGDWEAVLKLHEDGERFDQQMF